MPTRQATAAVPAALTSRAYERRKVHSRLNRFMAAGHGHCVVVGEDVAAIRDTVLRAAMQVSGMRILRLSARFERLNLLADLMHGSFAQSRTDASSYPELDAMFSEIAAARAGGFVLLVLIEDADLASTESLERARIAVETFASNTVPVRIVLLGGTFLPTILGLPRMRGLASRISARFFL
jgi:type II secretory pathway predicted ATPase ExeA